MKKRIVFTFLAAIVGLFAFTGCEKDQPYSYYQIGVTYTEIDKNIKPEEIDGLPTATKEKFQVALYLDQWLISNRYIRVGIYGNPVILYGGDEKYNDQQAIIFYDNQIITLDKEDLEKLIKDAQTELGDDGKPKLELETSGEISFDYFMTKGQSSVGTMRYENGDLCSKEYTIKYGPLTETINL